MSTRTSQNLLLVWDRVGDYHAARFLELERLHTSGKTFLADLAGSDSLYKWDNPVAGHPNYHPLSLLPIDQPDAKNRVEAFQRLVEKEQITCVGLAGYGRKEYNQMLIWCRTKGIRVVLFAESWYGNNFLFNKLKGLYLSRVCQGLLVSGERARTHFRQKLGMKIPLEIGYSVVDNAHFEKGRAQNEARHVLLSVARFAPEKNLAALISAFVQSDLAQTWTLKLVGGGPLKESLHQKAAGHPSVVFADWLSYSELPDLYASASFFILPSSFEPWGLVVNEAMAAGLPIALSEECGCRPDLLGPDNGFSFPAADEKELISVLNRISSLHSTELEKMGRASQTRIQAFSTKTWTHSFLRLAGISTA